MHRLHPRTSIPTQDFELQTNNPRTESYWITLPWSVRMLLCANEQRLSKNKPWIALCCTWKCGVWKGARAWPEQMEILATKRWRWKSVLWGLRINVMMNWLLAMGDGNWIQPPEEPDESDQDKESSNAGSNGPEGPDSSDDSSSSSSWDHQIWMPQLFWLRRPFDSLPSHLGCLAVFCTFLLKAVFVWKKQVSFVHSKLT